MDESNRVESEFECPICGVRRADLLVLVDNETVECVRCGRRYQPKIDDK